MTNSTAMPASKMLAWLFMVYVAVLPLAETIALRHMIMAAALLLVVFISTNVYRHSGLGSLTDMPLAWLLFLVWWGYLCVFPFFSESPEAAWRSFRSDWLMSISAGVVGCVVALFGGPSIVALILVCMTPVFIHWTLILLSWTGLLGPSVPLVMPWPQIWDALQTQLSSGVGAWIGNGFFPWQFRGIDPDHGNLGLAATQSVALLFPLLVTAWYQRNRLNSTLAFAGLVLCFGSVVIAMSRGALIFCALVVLTGLALQLLRHERQLPARLMGFYGVIFAVILGLGGLVLTKDPRWMMLNDKIKAAQMVEDPVRFFCNGLSPELEQQVRMSLKGAEDERIDAVLSGMSGDGGRFLAARAGLSFVAEHPWGVDGSRHVFKHLMQDACDGAPKIEFAHSHNGWIDLLLALGWIGAGLYISALIAMIYWGLKRFRQNPSNLWAQALLLTLVFWLCRGLVDSVYREHALLMQTALITYLAGRTRLSTA